MQKKFALVVLLEADSETLQIIPFHAVFEVRCNWILNARTRARGQQVEQKRKSWLDGR